MLCEISQYWPTKLFFLFQTAIIKNNPKKYLRSVGDNEEVEFDVVEGEKVNIFLLIQIRCKVQKNNVFFFTDVRYKTRILFSPSKAQRHKEWFFCVGSNINYHYHAHTTCRQFCCWKPAIVKCQVILLKSKPSLSLSQRHTHTHTNWLQVQ